MTGPRVLFLDDERASVETAMQYLDQHGIPNRYEGFDGYENTFEGFDPEIVVLDARHSATGTEDKPLGLIIYTEMIWARRFCPVVAYSAYPEEFAKLDHPLVKVVRKGKDSEIKVFEAINDLKAQVDTLHELEKEMARHIREQFAFVLRDMAPGAYKAFADDAERDKRNNVIRRAGIRRLAAFLDELAAAPKDPLPLVSWEQYICPPVCEDLQLGDILQYKGKPGNDPTSFRIVLTPSCDLSTKGGTGPRERKVRQVLLAFCFPCEDGITFTKLSSMKEKRRPEYLATWMLSPGYLESYLAIPALPNLIPHMVANLRKLELVEIDKVEDLFGQPIASIDSPFRELVAWAYMQTAARPGLPDRDFVRWSDEVFAAKADNA